MTRDRTYTPLPGWLPSAVAVGIVLAAHVVGPFIAERLQAMTARTLIAVDDALADITP